MVVFKCKTLVSSRALRRDTLCSSSFLSRSCWASVCILILLWYAFNSSNSCCSCIRSTWHSASCASSRRNWERERSSVSFDQALMVKQFLCIVFCLVLTACVESMLFMVWSYCSARMASFLVCSSFSLFSMVLCSGFGVLSSRWFRKALYCRVWILHVSWNCFLIWSSLDCQRNNTLAETSVNWSSRK